MRFERRYFLLSIAAVFLFFPFYIFFNSNAPEPGDAFTNIDSKPVELSTAEDLTEVTEPALDSNLLEETFNKAEHIPLLHSLLISQNGELLAEKYFNGANGIDPVNIKSASKSVLSALVGIALEKGYIESLDQTIIDFRPDYFDDQTDPLKKTITIRHLLNMSSGLNSTSSGNYPGWVASSNWVRNALNRPMVYQPGEYMLYSTGDSHILSAIITAATGMSTYDFAHKYLFKPLDIHIGGWDQDPQGIYFGGNNMAMSPRDLLKFGQTYLNNGYYNGAEIIPSNWVYESTQKHLSSTSSFRDFDYGYYWWLYTFGNQHVYFAWGYGGQFVFVIPDLNAVAVFTSSTDLRPRNSGHLELIHELLEYDIIPMLEIAPRAIAGK